MPIVNEGDAKAMTANWRALNGEIDHFNPSDLKKNLIFTFSWDNIVELMKNVEDNTIGIKFYIGCKELYPTKANDYLLLAVLVNVEDKVTPSEDDDNVIEKDDLNYIYRSTETKFDEIDSILDDSATIGFSRAKKYLKRYRDRDRGTDRKKEIKNYASGKDDINIKAFKFDLGTFYYLMNKNPIDLIFALGYKNKKHNRIGRGNHQHPATLIMTATINNAIQPSMANQPDIIDQKSTRKYFMSLLSAQGGRKSFDYSEPCPDACSSPPSLG